MDHERRTPDLQRRAQVADGFMNLTSEEIECSIPKRFEKVVRMYPGRLAVKAGDRALTYDALNRHANRIARAILEKRGLEREPIGLLFEHGIDVIAAIIGVLKAGKFYVVLDPTLPYERLEYILQDSRADLARTIGWHGRVSFGAQIIMSQGFLIT